MKINALWSAFRGPTQQPGNQKATQQEDRRRIPPCSIEEMDARLKALDEFLHEKDQKKAQVKAPPLAAPQRANDNKDPNALRTWFVLKSLNDGEGQATHAQAPGRLLVSSPAPRRP